MSGGSSVTRKREESAVPRRGWADKRAAILTAGLRVFGRDGYTRASIDVIAGEAGVSSRTIYNHFGGKEELFRSVIEYSATRVAEIQVGLVGQYLDVVTDLEADLIAFGCRWATSNSDFAEHFALVRQINAEIAHIPQATLDTWQETGPRRVRREIAVRLRHLAERGLLDVADPDRAASHLILLTATEVANRSAYNAVPPAAKEVESIVTDGVRTFLHGYQPTTDG
jgi:AcrR family transcriptional regulator